MPKGNCLACRAIVFSRLFIFSSSSGIRYKKNIDHTKTQKACVILISMEKLLNHYDKEYLKMAMLKHEETFREQVYELHRLYQIQKMLMKDTANNTRKNATTACGRPEARQCLDLERPVEGFSFPESADKRRVTYSEDDQSDLELTLGPKSYYQKNIKATEPAFPSDSGLSFSSSSSHNRGITRTITRDDILSQQKWGPEMPVSNNQDRLNSPPWLFQALSLNIT